MGTSQTPSLPNYPLPMLYTPSSRHRDQYFMQKYGIQCPRILHPLQWSGLDWIIKHSPMLPIGPGNNFYVSFAVQKIFTIMLQFLIKYRFGKWLCSEIMSNDQFSFGVFQWEVICDIQVMDPNVIFNIALVPDRTRGAPGTSELGIKIGKNGRIGGANLHFGLLPPSANQITQGSAERSVILTTNVQYLTFRIIWKPNYIRFQFQQGVYLEQNKEVLSWVPDAVKSLIPQKPLKIRMGLSLMNGVMGTTSGEDVDVLVKGFSYRPFEIDS